jgi:hypothetical protein
MERERNMKKHIFETTEISNPPNKKKIDRSKNLFFETILGQSLFIIVLNHNLLEQAGAYWV